MSDPRYIANIKVVLIGDGEVGKTTMAKNFLRNVGTIDTSYRQTIGADIHVKRVKYDIPPLGNISFTWLIFDLAGQHRFRYVHKDYYNGARAAIVVFDVSRPETFEHVPLWINDFISNVGSPKPMILIGNKIDLRDKLPCIAYESALNYTKTLRDALGVPVMYAETAALYGKNVEESFYNLAKIIVDYTIASSP